MEKEIYKIIDWNLGGNYETKMKVTKQILSLIGENKMRLTGASEGNSETDNSK